MSSHPVEIVQIGQILPHENADRLELATVKGWQVVVGKGSYVAGDSAVYVPIDSILEQKLEEYLFPPDAKVKLNKSRVKSIKLRGALSQGMLVGLDAELLKLFPKLVKKKVGDDVGEIIGVSKYEPPVPKYQQFSQKKKGSWKNHPLLTKYTDIENLKHYPRLFGPEDIISVTEKIHGTSARYGYFPRNTHGIRGKWTKLMMKLGIKQPNEFVYGSRNIQLQTGGKQFYDDNVYSYVAKDLKLNKLLQVGESLYGEIVGPGIQKGYDYGFKKPGHWHFYAYDVKINGTYLDPLAFREWCHARNIDVVPVLYEGKCGVINLSELKEGPSVIAPKAQPIREGIVIKPKHEQHCFMGRKVLKFVSDKYLLKNQTDFH